MKRVKWRADVIEVVDVMVQNPDKGQSDQKRCRPVLQCMSLEVENLDDSRGTRH